MSRSINVRTAGIVGGVAGSWDGDGWIMRSREIKSWVMVSRGIAGDGIGTIGARDDDFGFLLSEMLSRDGEPVCE